MRPRRRCTITIACLALLAGALPALAHPPGAGHRGPGPFGHGPGLMQGPGFEWMAERLELSDAQRGELHELFAGRVAEGAERRLDLYQAHRALAGQIHAESFDEAAIRDAAAAVAAIEADLAVARARRAQELRRILTPEQLAELEEIRELRHRFGHRGLGGPPPVDE